MSSSAPLPSTVPNVNWEGTLLAEKLINFLQQIPLKIEADLNRDLVIADDRDLIIQKTVLAAQAIFDAPQLWEDLIEGIKKVNNKVSDIETVINTLFLTTIPTLIKDKEEQLYFSHGHPIEEGGSAH